MYHNNILKTVGFAACFFALYLCIAGLMYVNKPTNAENVQGKNRMQWFREAKFGMFIHWGPYSTLAGEWNRRQVPVGENAEWIMKKLQIPVQTYRKLARQFNPVKFDAEEWVQLAQNAGMKYLVITAKHHDGFAMYHSNASPYNIVEHTPYKRDPMKDLARACAEADIKFCFYYSHREDWDHPDAYGNDWDYDPARKNFEKYLEEKSRPQLRELLTGYGDLGLIWFDRGLYTPAQAQAFVSIVRSLQPACLINGRVGNYDQELMGDYQNMNDNGMPIGGIEEYWETPQTMNETWGYSKFDTNWKNAREVIRRLAEVVSKGGNYLLNIGPTGEGVIPQASVDILNRVGQWMQTNSESIYGTTASPFWNLPWGCCTAKDNKLYLHVFVCPKCGELSIQGFKSEIRKAYLLNDRSRVLPADINNNTLSITVPDLPADSIHTVIVLEIEGELLVEAPVVRGDDDNTLHLDFVHAITTGKAVKRFNRKGKYHISKWTGPADKINWYIDVKKPGRYARSITYAALPRRKSEKYVVSFGAQKFTGAVIPTGDWYEYKTFDPDTIEFHDTGIIACTISPLARCDHDLMYFKEMILKSMDE